MHIPTNLETLSNSNMT